jgi:hypothetical protein
VSDWPAQSSGRLLVGASADRTAGNNITDEDLARVSLLAHAHTIPNGSYFQSPRRRSGIAPEPVMA